MKNNKGNHGDRFLIRSDEMDHNLKVASQGR